MKYNFIFNNLISTTKQKKKENCVVFIINILKRFFLNGLNQEKKNKEKKEGKCGGHGEERWGSSLRPSIIFVFIAF